VVRVAAMGSENEEDDKHEAGDEAAEQTAAVATKKKRKKRSLPEQPVGEEPAAVDTEAAPAPSRRKKVIAVVVVAVVALGVGGYLLAQSLGGASWAPATGEQVAVEITVIAADAQNLACASADEVAGRHCAFEANDKPWSKSTEQADDKTLKPYTTVDKRQLAAAGLWSQPALQGKLPTGRFTVACQFKVEGKLKKPLVRWASTGPFAEAGAAWPAGLLSDCKIAGAPTSDAGP